MNSDNATKAYHAGAAEPELSLRALFGILRRRLGLIVLLGVCGTALACLAAYFVPSKYTAIALIEILPPRQSEAGNGDPPRRVDQMAVDTHSALLTSRDFISKALSSLTGTSRSQPPASALSSRQDQSRPEAMGETKQATGSASVKSEPSAGARGQKLGGMGSDKSLASYEAFMKKYSVNQYLTSRVIMVRFTSTDPVRAAHVVNHIVETYVTDQHEHSESLVRNEIADLDKRLYAVGARIDKVQVDIQSLISRSGDDGATKLQRLAALREKAITDSQLLAKLRARKNEQVAQLGSVRPPIRVASRAGPPDAPSSLHPILFILPGALLSFLGAGLFAVLSEQFDRSLRGNDDVESSFQLPATDPLPRLSLSYRLSADDDVGLLAAPPPDYARAIRSIVANQGLLATNGNAKVVLVTSSLPGEGKSTLALSLAAFLAGLGQRVLVVDFEGVRSRVVNGGPHGASASSVNGKLDVHAIDDRIKRMPGLGCDRLQLVSLNSDPIVMFSAGGIGEMLMKLRSQYDRVIINGPALQEHPEAGLLAQFVDRLLLAVAWGETSKDVVRNSIQNLGRFVDYERPGHGSVSVVLTKSPQRVVSHRWASGVEAARNRIWSRLFPYKTARTAPVRPGSKVPIAGRRPPAGVEQPSKE